MTETKTETKTAPKAAAKKGKTLAEALALFQADLPDIGFDAKNTHFNNKYATLAHITKTVFPKLTECGLVFTTGSFVEDGKLVVQCHLLHADSGESRDAQFLITETQPQKVGSALSYYRRYGLGMLTGITPDEDDDGNAASQQQPAALVKAKDRAAAAPERPRQAASGSRQKIVSEFIDTGKASQEQLNDLTGRIKTEKGLKGEELFAEVLKALQNGEVG